MEAQYDDSWQWLAPRDTLDKKRFWITAGIGAGIYSSVSVGLYYTWYKDFELGGFRTFDDSREWLQMDKTGHWITTYNEAQWIYDGARWTGLNKKKSLIMAGVVSTMLQGTVEVMDGFSEKWGFSWSDVGFNTLGMASFVAQQAIWDEQRILFKASSNWQTAPNFMVTSVDGSATSSLRQRSDELFGTGIAERYLKDYNAVTAWASVNVRSFAPDSKWPKWLNVAVGYGASHLYGGFENEWTDEEGNTFVVPEEVFPRQRQYFLSLDIDFRRIPTKKRWLKTIFNILNFAKFPAPALEVTGLGVVKMHPIYF